VLSVDVLTPDRQHIAGFAIDSPPAGHSARGGGIEVNGWAIGREAAVLGVRAVRDDLAGRLNPLDVRRPDVAADYPNFPHADRSGFSLWAPAPVTRGVWHFSVEAILGESDAVPLAEFRCRSFMDSVGFEPESRLVEAPDFVIIGAQRGGTTSLYAYLSAHQQIIPAVTKEIHYLTDRHERGLDWYRGQFPAAIPNVARTGEATPYALFHPLAPRRLRDVAPHARIIALLRDPVTRAYSHYSMERARGDEPFDFAAAIAAEPARLAGEEDRLLSDSTAVSHAHKHFSYLARGDYAPQLARWLEHFPREQILVLRSEDLYAQPSQTFAQVASFLGIEPPIETSYATHNRSSGPPLDPTIRRDLAKHFIPRNAQLARLLGWDSTWNY
jgi:hypothetical protein